jgi:hypothetical protein
LQIKLVFKLPQGFIIDVAFIAEAHCGVTLDAQQFPHQAIVPLVMFVYHCPG